jgi:hypothetical protein
MFFCLAYAKAYASLKGMSKIDLTGAAESLLPIFAVVGVFISRT